MTRFDLVTVDLDGTLLRGTTVFEAVLGAHGMGERFQAVGQRYAAGLPLDLAIRELWGPFSTLTLQEIHRALRKAPWLDGIAPAVARLHDAGLRACLLTDQPSVAADFAARWGFEDAICSPCTVADGRPATLDLRLDKLANLDARLARWQIPRQRVCHVGNGGNDVPVFKAVAAGVAVDPEPGVAEHASVDVGTIRDLGVAVDAVLRLARAGP